MTCSCDHPESLLNSFSSTDSFSTKLPLAAGNALISYLLGHSPSLQLNQFHLFWSCLIIFAELEVAVLWDILLIDSRWTGCGWPAVKTRSVPVNFDVKSLYDGYPESRQSSYARLRMEEGGPLRGLCAVAWALNRTIGAMSPDC